MLRKILMTAFVIILTLITNYAKAIDSVNPFLGRWALYLPGGAGWLEVKQMDSYIDADLLWYGGSVTPCANAYMDGNSLVVTRQREYILTKDNQENPTRVHKATELYRFDLYGDQMVGELISPQKDGSTNVTRFTGKKIPPVLAAPDLSKVEYGKAINLLNGKDLSGWKIIGENKVNGWTISNGVLTNNPIQKEGQPHISYGNLRTVDTFEDFNLKLQVNIPAGSNSGIYLRGIYEVQVLDSYGKPLDSHNMGALYSRITPSVSAEKPAGSWQDVDITLCDRHLTVILNGTRIIDNQPILGCTGGALTADEFIAGPIYLQGDHGTVSYRNIKISPIIK
ncbi:DUF1080 domain-containing protein [Prolixibacteraceae bacterium Z1-6]|uniref:DUF1080 domain-containing protein n=1 Tax=Draconibacterium aestuarii TaxID=2998507 RepID=A0A9X3FBC2_9BACT|nr:DUF1080 domain-containing protein [Prolixibacteraceae bacterium Z1-6]